MKKMTMILIALMVVGVGVLSGCNEEKTDTGNQEVTIYDDEAFWNKITYYPYQPAQRPSDILNNTEETRNWAELEIKALDDNITIIDAFVVSNTYVPLKNEFIAYYNAAKNDAVYTKMACDATDNHEWNESLNYLELSRDYINQTVVHMQTILNLIEGLQD